MAPAPEGRSLREARRGWPPPWPPPLIPIGGFVPGSFTSKLADILGSFTGKLTTLFSYSPMR
jgi:hypothetical protein